MALYGSIPEEYDIYENEKYLFNKALGNSKC